ncbi:hypothetical protein VUR80DRAFT_1050 [Thermomyces stellatus]
MAPCLVIETSRFAVFVEWAVRENQVTDEKEERPETTLFITVKHKGVFKRLKETFGHSSARTKYKNVTEVRGHWYGVVPSPFESEDEKAQHRLLSIQLSKLKVHMVSSKAPFNIKQQIPNARSAGCEVSGQIHPYLACHEGKSSFVDISCHCVSVLTNTLQLEMNRPPPSIKLSSMNGTRII